MHKRMLIALALFATLATACNTWERNTYNTLASSKAVIDGAAADYESAKIPQTKCAYSIITNARTADTVAVNAMVVYEQVKLNKGNVAAQVNVVTSDLSALAPLVTEISALVSNPATKCPGPA